MNNIGRVIRNFYCNGYFGREYDLAGAIIIAEGDEYLVIRKENGYVDFCNFQTFPEKDGFINMNPEKRQELIDSWCKGEE